MIGAAWSVVRIFLVVDGNDTLGVQASSRRLSPVEQGPRFQTVPTTKDSATAMRGRRREGLCRNPVHVGWRQAGRMDFIRNRCPGPGVRRFESFRARRAMPENSAVLVPVFARGVDLPRPAAS